MADTKISDLPTDVTALVDADKFAVADASALTSNPYATALVVKTHATTSPVFAAGTASAGTWPKLTSGTKLTTAEVGALEYDGDALYSASDAGNRGVMPCWHIIRQDGTYVLTSTTAEQKLFNASTNGRLTLETGTYFFRCQFSISGMDGAGTSNAAFDILGAGGATVGTVLYHAIGTDGTTGVAAAQDGSTMDVAQSPASIVVARTNTALQVHMTGTFEITVAGTIVPSVTLVVAAAATVAAGSYFMCCRIGSTTMASVGQWD